MSKKSAKPASYPEFLKELLEAKSPTGHEFAAQKVIDDHVEKSADKYSKDALGNRIAELKGDGGPTLMFAGHIDEIGLIISHVDDKGYLYFEFLGGHDQIIPSGRRLHILTRNGPVLGITGKRAVHLLSPEDRKRVPERHDMWIDIGVNNRADALAIVRIGDPAIYTDGPEILRGSIGVARAFDDKAGAYVCMEAFRRLSKEKKLSARVVSVATTQEEIGTGAKILGIDHLFEAILGSREGFRKGREHMDFLKKQFGLSSAAIVFVGDEKADMRLAGRLGLRTVGIARDKPASELREEFADAVILRLQELKDVVESIA